MPDPQYLEYCVWFWLPYVKRVIIGAGNCAKRQPEDSHVLEHFPYKESDEAFGDFVCV